MDESGPLATTRYLFAFDRAYVAPALLAGVTPRTAHVDLGPRGLRVRFGLWRMETTLANIESARRSGGFSWLKTVGPPRLSLADRGVTCATNGSDAVCLTFREPVRVMDPFGLLRHPGATLTLADPQAFLDDLETLKASD